jgi:signal transduction histidine kinase/ligand-binding sensor domain-containing protein
MHRNTILFLLSFLFCDNCLSQQYPFIHYTPKDGLVNNRARFMFQDRKGLLYISTFGGLSVYDGSRFSNYTTDNGLSTNVVNDIVEMGEDSLWIIPNFSGLHCLVKGRIKDFITSDGFYPVINKMIRCSDGFYYAIADEGLFRFEKNHFEKINLADNTGRDAGRFLINAAEIKNKLFLLTDINIHSFPGHGHLVVYDFKNKKVPVSNAPIVHFILLSPAGDILASTDEGVRKLDELALSQNKVQFISLPAIYQAAEKYVANYMYFDQQQNLWLSTIQGIVKISKQGIVKIFSVGNGLPTNNNLSIFQDRENTMWFLDGQAGMSKLANPAFEFYAQIKPGFLTTDIYTDSKTDSTWFLDATHHKLLLQYRSDLKEFRLSGNLLSPPYKFITANGNKNYLSDLFNVYQCNFLPNNQVRLSLLHADSSRNINDRGVNCILPDGYGNLLAASEDIRVLRQNRKPLTYSLGYFSDKFVITSDNHLWAVTRERKLFSFLIHPDSPDHYLQLLRIYKKELPDVSPRSITVDKNGNVWIGSRDHGLFCLFFDGLTLRSWKQITTREGLSDNFISYLHTDENDNIWACSPAGLDKIQLRNGKFFIENTTRSNNIYQYIVKIQTSKEAVHWVQTQGGIIRIAPAETSQNNFQPKIIFREIYEGRTKINDLSGLLSLSYKENNLSFSIAAPSFIDEKQIRFSYLLEGSRNKSWSDPSSQAFINLVNLAPGKYTLKAKATFVDGHYADSETSFSFVVHSPWWQTWWFRLAMASVMIIMFWLIVRSYYRRKLYQQRMALEKHQAIEKERTRIATDMHDDLGSGLSTIRFLSEKVKRNTSSTIAREDIDRMQVTSNELIDKMNEIIWCMNEKNDSLEDLLLYIRSYAMEYCEDNNLNCSIELTEDIPVLFVSGETRRNIFLTVKESLHNIVKHACAKNVFIIIDSSNSLGITISDNGKGCKDSPSSGSGNGLRNMYKRIGSVGGSISIQNENGTTVSLKIPLA